MAWSSCLRSWFGICCCDCWWFWVADWLVVPGVVLLGVACLVIAGWWVC